MVSTAFLITPATIYYSIKLFFFSFGKNYLTGRLKDITPMRYLSWKKNTSKLIIYRLWRGNSAGAAWNGCFFFFFTYLQMSVLWEKKCFSNSWYQWHETGLLKIFILLKSYFILHFYIQPLTLKRIGNIWKSL